MRYGIFSDVHANLEALDSVIKAYQGQEIDKYFCAGDLVGYGANPKECIQKIRLLGATIVAGNHDWGCLNLYSLSNFNSRAKEALIWVMGVLDAQDSNFLESLELVYKNKDFTLVHGSLDNPQDFNYLTDGYIAAKTLELLENNICFVGHTHSASVFFEDTQGQLYYSQQSNIKIEPGYKYIINVGSLGQPRDGDIRACYCIYDTDANEVWIKRIEYDIESARKKIISSGMPAFFGDRLLAGR